MRMKAAKKWKAVFAGVMICGASESAVFGQPLVFNRPHQAAVNLGGRQMLQAQNEARITVRGARISFGDGVDCPKIRSDDGTETSVSYLAPGIAIGERVEVTGFMAFTTICRGKVLYAEEVRIISN